MPKSCVQVARGLLLHGQRLRDGAMTRDGFLEEIGVNPGTFRSAGDKIGAIASVPGFRFFESSVPQTLAFGPGAGVVLGISLGSWSLRAALFDANGWRYHEHESEPWPGQRQARPSDVLDRIRHAASAVMDEAFGQSSPLLVDGRLPFLGVAMAWPSPLNREKRPVGHSLPGEWRNAGRPLDQQVARHLRIPIERSHALNDAHAAAIAVAYAQTRNVDHVGQRHPRLAVVLRLGGGIGGGAIIVEPPEDDRGGLGRTSGFPASVLIAGVDHHAGEIGHVRLEKGLVEARNKGRPKKLRALRPFSCSCSEPRDKVPDHLEAYASAQALARRIDPKRSRGDVVRDVCASPAVDVNARALEDTGALIGTVLRGPAAMLNPASITLTGTLAVPAVRDEIAAVLSEAHVFGTQPEVVLLDDEDNKFVRAQGAALAVLRQQVHRRLDGLVGVGRVHLENRLGDLVHRLDGRPW